MLNYGRRSEWPSLWILGCSITAPATLLVLMIVPRILSRGPISRRGAPITQIEAFKSAVEFYIMDHGQPPATLAELIEGDKRYLADVEAIPKDCWGNDYVYQAPGPNGRPFLITCWGADGKPGGVGDEADITSEDAAVSP